MPGGGVVRDLTYEDSKMTFIDQQIVCAGCGAEFVWSAGEQAFYAERGLNRPRRCSPCAKTRRQELEDLRRASAWPPEWK
jgi:hypothetical protein